MSCQIIKRIQEEMERDRDYKLLKNNIVKAEGKIDTEQKPGSIEAFNLDFKCAFTEKPKCDQPGNCSKSVLVIRDRGHTGSAETYTVTRYKEDGWGYVPSSGYIYGVNMHNWLDQESNGYRVVKWAYLPDLPS